MNPLERWGPLALMAAGGAVSAAGAALDILGGQPGLGRSQLIVISLGLLMILIGAVLRLPTIRPRLGTIELPGDERDPWGLARLAIWFGLVAGLADPAILHLQNLVGIRFLYVNPHMSWMSPASYVILLLATVLPLLALGRGPMGWLGSRRTGATVLTFVTATSLLLLFHPEIHEYATLALAAGLAATVWRTAKIGVSAFRTLVDRTTWPAIGAVALVVAVQLGGPAAREALARQRLPPASPGAPNVLLIVLDTVRGANVSMNGYARPTTPNLTRRAAAGVVFERAIATAPWSLPTHVSLVTGLYPHEFRADWTTPLGDSVPTLAEELGKRGFLSAGFFANKGFGGRHAGLDRGFHHWDVDVVSVAAALGASQYGRMFMEPIPRLEGRWHNINRLTAKDGAQVSREFLDWVGGVEGRPFFAFLNYMDAHAPYEAPPGWEDTFEATSRPPIPRHHSARVPPEALGAMIDAYDASIAFLDDQLERILRELDRSGVLANTLVIVVSDHGEEFDENGRIGHGRSLLYPVLHVPLVMWLPDRIPAGVRVRDLVSVRDVPATVLRLVGDRDAETLPGRPLSRFWGPEPKTPERPDEALFAAVSDRMWLDPEGERHRGNLLATFRESRHYIRVETGEESLYDVDRDPWEQLDLGRDPSVRDELSWFRRRTDSIASDYSRREAGGRQ